MNNLYSKLGTEPSTQDKALLNIFFEDSKNLIRIELGLKECPADMFFIAEDIAIAKFRRIGAEAVSAEGVDVVSQTYITNPLEPHMDAINAYRAKHCGKLVAF